MRVHALTRPLLPLLLLAGTPAAAAPTDDFRQLLTDHWTWVLAENPGAGPAR